MALFALWSDACLFPLPELEQPQQAPCTVWRLLAVHIPCLCVFLDAIYSGRVVSGAWIGCQWNKNVESLKLQASVLFGVCGVHVSHAMP